MTNVTLTDFVQEWPRLQELARDLWGDEERISPTQAQMRGINLGGSFDNGGNQIFQVTVKKGWKLHLQEMVIADDPIKYLGEHLDD